MPVFLILCFANPCVSRRLFIFPLALKWSISATLPFPSPRIAVVHEENLALKMGRACTHVGENEEGKAEKSRMLSLLSC